jgi:hypothetical protein
MTISWPAPAPKSPPTRVDPDAVYGHDGKVYRALTVKRIDIHLREISERIGKLSDDDVKDLYKVDRDHLLERRLFLAMCPAETSA